jgi:hypothetical protein
MDLSRPRILFIYPNSWLDTNPTLTILLQMLSAREVDVTVLLYKGSETVSPAAYGDNIKLQFHDSRDFYDYDWNSAKALLRRILRTLRHPHRYAGYSVRKDLAYFKHFHVKHYSAIVGIDPYGIVIADMLNDKARKPLIYMSFELMFQDEVSGTEDEYLKTLESAACKRASLVLTQDEERAEAFCRENEFDAQRVMMAPVAPPPQKAVKSDRLRTMLDIPGHKRIVLFCGNLDVWSSRDDLAEMISYWSEEYCLVIHNFTKIAGRQARFLKGLAESGRVYVSPEPVGRDELVDLIASADFGLAPYKPVPNRWWDGDNLYHLGLASGKVAYYALCGLPILARSLPVFEREFARYPFGKVYRRLADTGILLQEMDKNYTQYSEQARRFYRERLDPMASIGKFCDRLMSLASSTTGVNEAKMEKLTGGLINVLGWTRGAFKRFLAK